MTMLFVYLILVFLISFGLILLVLFSIKTEKDAYDKLKFGFMDQFAGHTDVNVPVQQITPIVHERIERLPEESFEESEDDEILEEEDPEELPWEE